MGICTLLFIVFLVLKLCGVIAWSWWVVFSPILAEVLLSIVIFILQLWFITSLRR